MKIYDVSFITITSKNIASNSNFDSTHAHKLKQTIFKSLILIKNNGHFWSLVPKVPLSPQGTKWIWVESQYCLDFLNFFVKI